jgi:hypothetical protein
MKMKVVSTLVAVSMLATSLGGCKYYGVGGCGSFTGSQLADCQAEQSLTSMVGYSLAALLVIALIAVAAHEADRNNASWAGSGSSIPAPAPH